MVHRDFCGVNSLSTSQALSSVVEVAQGVFLANILGVGLVAVKRPPIWCDRWPWVDFDLAFIDIVFIGTYS